MDSLINALASLESWMLAHEASIELALVWLLAIGNYVASAVEFATYGILLHNISGSLFGRRLRLKKIAYGAFMSGNGSLFSAMLFGHYAGESIAFWGRMGLYAWLAGAMLAVILFGVLWLISYVREVRTSTRSK